MNRGHSDPSSASGRGLFGSALATMDSEETDLFGPVAFQDYCRTAMVSPGRTAAHISVDSLDRLDRGPREAHAMVLRLGQRKGGKTDFAIVRVGDEGPECFFLVDEVVFGAVDVRSFVPECSIRSLLPFHLLNQLTERSATQLAYSTGLLQRALGLDDPIAIPVTDSGVYAFDFVPHEGFPHLNHNRGQVEIDGLFVGRRAGADSVFVVEAKVGSRLNSVAKHKLAYPIYGMSGNVPADVPIVPVYLRIVRESHALVFYVAECNTFGPGKPLTALAVRVVTAFRLVLPSLSVA